MKKETLNLTPQEISEQISSFDWNSMDKIYEPISKHGNTEQKEALAYDGYLSYLSQIAYDFICGKLPDAELSHFLDPIEKAEALLGQKQWLQRGFAYFYSMDIDLKNKNLEDFLKNGTEAIQHFQHSIAQKDDDFEDNYNKIASIYENFAKELKKDSFLNWSRALASLQEAIALNPLKAEWFLYIQLLYSVYDFPALQEAQKKEKEIFDRLTENVKSENIFHLVAMAYVKYRESLEFSRQSAGSFSEKDYLFYLEKSLVRLPKKLTYFSAIDSGQFFHKEGLRLKRIDILEVAVTFFQKTIGTQQDRLLGIHRMSNIYENIADIYQLRQDTVAANSALKKAIDLLTENIEQIETDFSCALTYAEFLERCLTKVWYKEKPSIDGVRKYASLAEKLGKGYNTSASAILVRLFLLENQQDEAIFVLTKELILHENCLNRFLNDLQFKSFSKFNNFVAENKKFFEELKEHYYYDPKINWDELQKMSQEEIFRYWENRKIEIKNRPRHDNR